MDYPILYRKRIIPDECILLKNDVIQECSKERIITTWKTIKPRADMDHGASCYFLNEGYKISKFCRKDGSLLYWYCDIVDYNFKEDTNELIVTDLLADVIIYPNGNIKVVDLDELVKALDDGTLSLDLLKSCLLRLDSLLKVVYSDNFGQIRECLDKYI